MKIRAIKQSDNEILARLIRNVFEEHNAPKSGTVYSDPTTNNLYEFNNLVCFGGLGLQNNRVHSF